MKLYVIDPLKKNTIKSNQYRKKSALSLAITVAILYSNSSLATNDNTLPTGENVISGNASFTREENSLNIRQHSQHTSINWESFDIGRNSAVEFDQPSTDSIAVNRVMGLNGSEILGRMSSNGQVFIINPNGVLFGQDAKVNVGGLVASTLNIDDDHLSLNQRHFSSEDALGSVENNGQIIAADGGYVALLGKSVKNNGVISASLGTVAMASGQSTTLTFAGNSLVSLEVEQGAIDALAENSGLIRAPGGSVYMTANAADELTRAVVNHSGIIEAQTLVEREGKIILLGDMAYGTTTISGELDASAPESGDGGFIETSAAQVTIEDSTRITTQAVHGDTGEWLVDPTDYIIAASGGDITATTLAANLATTNVTLQSDDGGTGTNGDVLVNEALSWSSNNTLTLTAFRNVDISEAITNSAGGSLVLRAGNTANGIGTVNFLGSGSVSLSGGGRTDVYYNPTSYATPTSYAGDISGTQTAWMLVNDVNDLQAMNSNISTTGIYSLAGDIDASATIGWNAGEGFEPIASVATRFEGQFDGLNYTISDLTINRPTENYVGLFSATETGSNVSNVSISGGSISGRDNVGAVIGFSASVMDSVNSDISVSGRNSVGGISGLNFDNISNSYALGNVNSTGSRAGGLVGRHNGGTITASYAQGDVIAVSAAGGLVGQGNGGDIRRSYAVGNTNATTDMAGGLVGHNASGDISETYATGTSTSPSQANGLIGQADTGTFSANFFDTTTTGHANGSAGITAGIIGLTSAQMQSEANFNSATADNGGVNPNWDLTTTWRIYDTNTRPLLRALLTEVTATVADVNREYDGASYSGAHSLTLSIPSATLLGTTSYSAPGTNAGSYAINASGLYSTDQFGFDVVYVDGSQTITPRALGITGSSIIDRAYDGTTTASVSTGTLSGLVGAETLTVSSAAGSFSDADAGSGKNVNVSYTLTDGSGLATNYTLADEVLTGSISPAAISLGTTDINRSYDGTTNAAGTLIITSGTLFGTDSMSGGSFIFDSPHADTGKTVTVSGATVNDGNSGNNYDITYENNTNSSISAASLTITSVDINRTYDGTTDASGSAIVSAGNLFGTDSITGGSFSFDSRDAGTDKTVTVDGVMVSDGNGGDNYNVTYGNNTTSTITPANITLSTSDVSRVYDGTNTANGSAIVSSGNLFSTDTLSGGTYNFDTPHAGTDKSVSVSDVTINDGNGGNNYSIAYLNNSSSTITRAAIEISTLDINRVYDGTTDATGAANIISGNLFGTDTMSGGTFAFDSRDVGAAKRVSVSGVNINDGNDGNNYSLSYRDNTTSSITAASIVVTSADVIKVYDATTDAAGSAMLSSGSLFGSDTLSGGSYQFADANVGEDKILSVSDVTINDGNNGNNYNISFENNVTSRINAAPLTVTVSSGTKVYDGEAYNGGLGLSYSGFVGTDSESAVTGDATYSGSAQGAINAGSYNINVNGLSAQNYTLNIVEGQYTITPATLSYIADPTVVQDGQTLTLSGALGGLVGSDSIESIASGEILWRSLAPEGAPPGFYDIEGYGLTINSPNYASEIFQSASNTDALQLINAPESPVVVAVGGAQQVLREDEEDNEPITYSTDIQEDEDRKIIFDISVRNEGIRLPEGLSQLK